MQKYIYKYRDLSTIVESDRDISINVETFSNIYHAAIYQNISKNIEKCLYLLETLILDPTKSPGQNWGANLGKSKMRNNQKYPEISQNMLGDDKSNYFAKYTQILYY